MRPICRPFRMPVRPPPVTVASTSTTAQLSPPIVPLAVSGGERTQPVSSAVQRIVGQHLVVDSVASASSTPRGKRLTCARRNRSICSATATARSAEPRLSRARSSARRRILNKTSIKPAVYGERFVKRRGLFSMTVASRHGVVSGCVSRQDHDRSAVHQLDTDRSGRRAGGSDAVAGAGLADFRSQPKTIAPPPRARC